MTDAILSPSLIENSSLLFPPEWIKSALVVTLISVWVVIALFGYLNRFVRQPYFSLWTVAWMFYSGYLAAAIGLQESPDTMLLIMTRNACLGISALFMYWGSFALANQPRSQRELGGAVLLILIWSYVAAFVIHDRLWITVPVFALLATAGIYASWALRRQSHRHSGARVLGTGFFLWGLHLLGYPFIEASNTLVIAAYLVSTLLSLLITIGMVTEHETVLSDLTYRTLFNSVGDVILLVEPKTYCILEANPAAERLDPTTSLVGKSLLDVFPELREGSPQQAFTCRELTHTHDNGRLSYFESNMRAMPCGRGGMLLMDARDITNRKRDFEALRQNHSRLELTLGVLRQTQHQIIQQERLRAVAKMASGVAHDFNNRLSLILGYNELLMMQPENIADPQRVRQTLQMVNEAVAEATGIVRRLREFYRPRQQSEITEVVSLNACVEKAIRLTEPSWRSQALATGITIQIHTDLNDIPPLAGRGDELCDLLMYLIANSVEALPTGGTITIATDQAAGHIQLTVADTGLGMTEEVHAHCLEPFYTTKGQSHPGLGLAIVYGIVQRHDGTLKIENHGGYGTVVSIRFPALAKAPVVIPSDQTFPRLHVLIVDDQPQMCRILSEYLEEQGHTTETLTNGREALERFRQRPFDLVVTDCVMPDLSGDQLAAAIKDLAPATPVIIVTGYCEALAGGAAVDVADLVIAKPFSRAVLLQAVTQVLTRRSGQNSRGAKPVVLETAA